ESLWIFDENPVFSSVAADQWREALKKIPLVVNFSTFMTETAEMADFVLPQPTFMERRGLVNAPLVSPFPIVGYMQPIIKPLYNTRDAGEIVLDIAHRIDDNVARKFPWKNFEAFHDKCLENVYKERRGTLFTNFHEEAHVKHLEERGWWMPKHTTFKAFKKEFIKKGGWWDPYHSTRQWGRVFKTSSHKFEFFPQTLADTALNMRLDLESEGMSSREAHQSVLRTFGLTENANGTFLPHYEPIHVNGKTSEFPLFLWLYKPLVFSDSYAANLPWLQEYLVPHIAVRWGSWVEINPETAHTLNLRDRQMVWMESPNGRIKIQIRTYEGTMPDVVSCILGQGHTALGRWAKGAGENPLTLLNWQYDHLAGSPALLSTRVRLYKA
ncbi:MAG: molybdopterin dinucleotide binding domain-containing protein, partial [Waddliaceae bacterium]